MNFLEALEDQIKVNRGIDIGERWSIRLSDGECQDLFIQDKKLKGYYRFPVTECDWVV